jgi:hypothetical protein
MPLTIKNNGNLSSLNEELKNIERRKESIPLSS